MNLIQLLIRLGILGSNITDVETGGSTDRAEIEDTQDPYAQKILDSIKNGETEYSEADDDIELPSDKDNIEEPEEENQGELIAGKYKSIDELKKGIANLKSTLPDYVIDGMSEEALVKHYQELSKEFSKGRKHAVDDGEQKEKEPKKEDKPKEAKGIPSDVWNELSDSFNTKGGLTQEQYDKLESFGIPTEIVDNYLDGLIAKQNIYTKEIHELAGGEEQYNAIKEWATDNIDTEYLQSLSTMNPSQAKSAMLGIKAQYELANKQTTRIVGNKSGSSSTGAYSSQEAYLKDVKDPRYSRDELFRRKVDSKLSRSRF